MDTDTHTHTHTHNGKQLFSVFFSLACVVVGRVSCHYKIIKER